ncbi:MAG: DUF6515 family protein [bacterium]
MRTILILLAFVFTLSSSSCARRVVVATPNTKTVNVVRVAPKNHKVVVVKGRKYYYWNGRYHQKTRKGYVVVKVR